MIKVIKGFNDFESTYSDLANRYWDYDKNEKLPSQVYFSSQTGKYYFKCDKGHSFKKSISSFLRGVKGREGACPVCSGRLFVKGENDLETLRPELLEFWDYSNNSVKPSDVFYNNRKDYFWFKCSKGHKFESTIHSMVRSYNRKTKGCPICAGKKVVEGENDFLSRNKDLVSLWDYSKNSVSPSTINYKDKINKYWFKCNKGHSFESTPFNLIERQKYSTKGCPVCSGHKVVSGVNDILTLFPERMKEWSYDLNKDINPRDLPKYSTKEMIAVCGVEGCNNTYVAQVQNWVRGKVNNCEEHRLILNGRSQAAHDIAEMIKSWGIEVIEEVCLFEGNNSSVDMYIPSYKIAIEYNGLVWHTENNVGRYKHYKKYKMCKSVGVNLIQLWEDDWLNKRDLVISFLENILGLSSFSISAYDCTVIHVSEDIAKKFSEVNSLKEFVVSEEYIALSLNNEIVAIISIDGIDRCIVINNYVTSCHIQGGLKRLLGYIKSYYITNKFKVVTDNCTLDYIMYDNLGFYAQEGIKQDYCYLHKGKRWSKSVFNKEIFKNDSSLSFKEGLTLDELVSLNKIRKIWNAGSSIWVKNVQ